LDINIHNKSKILVLFKESKEVIGNAYSVADDFIFMAFYIIINPVTNADAE